VLGNHDWGGIYFNAGWDQQIAYTWASDRWVMPAAYYSQRVRYPDQGFTVDYFMLDSNAFDALDPDVDESHNICGNSRIPAESSCASAGGPQSLATCKNWFWDLWGEQKVWVEDKLTKSDADWKIIVTHFPCGFEAAWFATLHQKYGLDLLVTGHRHDQELWSSSSALGGLTCFVTGGGGGITSEASPRGIDTHQYGFFDLTISKAHIKIECINIHGVNIGTSMVYPRR